MEMEPIKKSNPIATLAIILAIIVALIGIIVGLNVSSNKTSNIAETEDGFAVGYSGAVVKNDELLSDGFDTIYTFTWDGEPEKVYKLDFRITAFDIDRESGIAYCITSEEVPGVVCFGLI